MKRIHITQRCTWSFVIAGILLLVPHATYALGDSGLGHEPLIITEVLPGTSVSASQEFIEIYNQSNQSIDLMEDGWELQIASSKATTWDKPKTVALPGVIKPGGYVLITSNHKVIGEEKTYLQDYALATFSPGLTSSTGHVRLAKKTTSAVIAGSTVEWTTRDAGGSLTSIGITSDPVILESPVVAGSSIKRLFDDVTYIFTNRFATSPCPSPTSRNNNPIQETLTAPIPADIDIANPLCKEIVEEEEESGVQLPRAIPPAVLLPAEVAMQNVTVPQASSNKGLFAPRITELLPNPDKPLTDGADEFIELYNENTASFDLSGYILFIGTSASKKYIFPKNTILRPKSFTAFYSHDTKIGLSNTAGRVVLTDPLGKELSATQVYGKAGGNQAWAFAQDKWQWTSRVTPGASNVISTPAAATSKKSKTTVPKPKSVAAGASGTSNVSTVAGSSKLIEKPESPIHPVALAVVGLFAVLYGAYEYRHDMANKFFQLRSYRAARRENRQSLKGR